VIFLAKNYGRTIVYIDAYSNVTNSDDLVLNCNLTDGWRIVRIINFVIIHLTIYACAFVNYSAAFRDIRVKKLLIIELKITKLN